MSDLGDIFTNQCCSACCIWSCHARTCVLKVPIAGPCCSTDIGCFLSSTRANIATGGKDVRFDPAIINRASARTIHNRVRRSRISVLRVADSNCVLGSTWSAYCVTIWSIVASGKQNSQSFSTAVILVIVSRSVIDIL